jgi:hypothetical protein
LRILRILGRTTFVNQFMLYSVTPHRHATVLTLLSSIRNNAESRRAHTAQGVDRGEGVSSAIMARERPLVRLVR